MLAGPPIGFYHICTLGDNWKTIVQEQVDKIRETPHLRDVEIRVSIVGSECEWDELPESFNVVYRSEDPGCYERWMLEHLRQFALRNDGEDRGMFYFHSKGVSHKTDLDDIGIWRRMMMHVLCDPETPKSRLLEYDAVGMNYLVGPQPHFSGNFWWTKSSYVRTLGAITSQEYLAPEMWICGNPRGQFCNVFHTRCKLQLMHTKFDRVLDDPDEPVTIAWYHDQDVTEKVRLLVDEDQVLRFPLPFNQLFGFDPAPGVRKTLKLYFRDDPLPPTWKRLDSFPHCVKECDWQTARFSVNRSNSVVAKKVTTAIFHDVSVGPFLEHRLRLGKRWLDSDFNTTFDDPAIGTPKTLEINGQLWAENEWRAVHLQDDTNEELKDNVRVSHAFIDGNIDVTDLFQRLTNQTSGLMLTQVPGFPTARRLDCEVHVHDVAIVRSAKLDGTPIVIGYPWNASIPLPSHISRGTLYRALVHNAKALEIDGPSIFFENEKLYKRLRSHDNVTLAEGTNLSRVQDETYDLLLSWQTLQRTVNPLKALRAWHRVLKPRGCLMLVLPWKLMSGDRLRPITKLAHILQDFVNDTDDRDLTHLPEILELHDLKMDPAAGTFDEFLKTSEQNAENGRLHHHVFDLELIVALARHSGFVLQDFDVVAPNNLVALLTKS